MKRGISLISQGVVCLMALAVVAVCGGLLPELAREEAVGKVNHPSAMPYLIGAWVMATPIFVALYQAFILFGTIDSDTAISQTSVRALQIMKYCALIFGGMIVLGAIVVIVLARSVDPTEDVTPVITIGFILAFVSTLIATFIAVLQKLLGEAIVIKSENDLIV